MIWTKEISDFFIVQFEVRGTHEELNIGRAFDDFKNVVESPGRDPSLMRGFLLTLHGMSFPCACLAIGKDGAIITLNIDEDYPSMTLSTMGSAVLLYTCSYWDCMSKTSSNTKTLCPSIMSGLMF